MRVLGNNRGPVSRVGTDRQHGLDQSRKRFAVPSRPAVARELLANLPVLRWRQW